MGKYKKLKKRIEALEKVVADNVFKEGVNLNYVGLFPEDVKHQEDSTEGFMHQVTFDLKNNTIEQEIPFDLTGLRVEVGNAENSRKLQEYAFKKGFKWCMSGVKVSNKNAKVIMFWNDKDMSYSSDLSEFSVGSDGNTYRLTHYNDIKHHIEGFKRQHPYSFMIEAIDAFIRMNKKAIELKKLATEKDKITCGEGFTSKIILIDKEQVKKMKRNG